MSFDTFKLAPSIMAGVRDLGYRVPTPIQEQAIPSILEGRDLIGLAQTGTGKTAAFALPVLQRLLKRPRGRVIALVISPTRELADQTCEAFNQLGRATGLRSIAIYGGVGITPQVKKLRDGAEIVVACPGRLLDHLRQGAANLKNLEVLVIDEADRMFDMGFLPDIRKILGMVPTERQTLLFAATMPDDVRDLATSILRDPVTVKVGETAPAATVSHAIYTVDQRLKTPLLMKLLDAPEMKSVLVFTRTKARATRLAAHMKKAGQFVTLLQGDLPQNKRQEALTGFRTGKYRVLVATDIAARGIDVSSISHVVNFDMPDTVEAYTHRIGRTGRAAMTGDAYTFVTGEDRAFVWSIENALGEKIEKRILEDFDYSVPPESREERRPERSGRGGRQGGARTRRSGAEKGVSSPSSPRPAGPRPQRRDLSTCPFLLGTAKSKSRR